MQGDDSHELEQFKFLDVTPLNLGVNVVGGYTSVIIPRNTRIPAKFDGNYTTVYDNQTEVTIEVSEGDNEKSDDNDLLGKFHLNNIPPKPACVPKISITFVIDENNILHAEAVEKTTCQAAKMKIDYGNKRLTQTEKDDMIRNIDDFRKQDKKKRDCIRSKNELERFCFRVQEKIKSAGVLSGISKENKHLILMKCSDIIEWIKINNNEFCDAQEYEARKKELEKMVESARGFFFFTMMKDFF